MCKNADIGDAGFNGRQMKDQATGFDVVIGALMSGPLLNR